MTGGSDRLPLNWFPLWGTNASQLGLAEARPSTGRASSSCGTSPVTSEASPSTEEVHAPRTSPGVCAETQVSNEWYISFVDCANTVVFFPLALRQRTHRNAIGLSRYCTEDSRLTEWCQDGTIPVWRKNRKHAPCASTNKIPRLWQRFGGTLVSPQTMRPSGLRCSERCEKLNSVPLHSSPK